ncbi:hypothetical protein ILUMI_17641 [Ignelater luminosus]|uniref:Uncharacterized protein n=1 Tax=Ignelater luminosus TaxID=2038154 RepID=A0A8K0CJI0_IGNLU|nr:hypothetical protein ILUMI_17641 [Ignelater luminosus]
MAEENWLTASVKGHQLLLSIRTPESTSLARMTSFNKHNVGVLSWDSAASPQNIKSGFYSTEISPFDPDIFKDIDFMSFFVSDSEIRPVASTSTADTTYAGVATVSTANQAAQATRVTP